MNNRQIKKKRNLASIQRIEGYYKAEALSLGLPYKKQSPTQRKNAPLRSFNLSRAFVNETVWPIRGYYGRYPHED